MKDIIWIIPVYLLFKASIKPITAMAKLTGNFDFTGTLGNISAYTRRGSDKIILRLKGGPSKKKIKTHPRFEPVRNNNMEFGGRSSTIKRINLVISPLKPLADFNIASAFQPILKRAQLLDTVSKPGTRNVLLSRHPRLFEGFDFNRQNSFSSIIRSPLSHTLSRTSLTPAIEIPQLIPGINFFIPGKYPLFSFIATVGAVPDMTWRKFRYEPFEEINLINCYQEITTAWLPCVKGAAASAINFSMTELPKGSDWSLLLTVGIRFATVGGDGEPEQIKYAGAGKILAAQ